MDRYDSFRDFLNTFRYLFVILNVYVYVHRYTYVCELKLIRLDFLM